MQAEPVFTKAPHARKSCLLPCQEQMQFVTKPVQCMGTLRKTRRQRQQELHKTTGLRSKTIAVHVRYNAWYTSLPSSEKQQRERTKFCLVWKTWTTTANFSYFYLELIAFVACSVGTSFNTDKHTEEISTNEKFQSKIETHLTRRRCRPRPRLCVKYTDCKYRGPLGRRPGRVEWKRG